MPSTSKVLLATTNKGKIKEFLAMLSHLDAEILTPGDLDIQLDVDETGLTYAENAKLKAVAFSKQGIITLADDSGLEVDALGGAPGIRSARYAPQPEATDADRRKYLIQQLGGIPQPWTARFRCAIALAEPDGMLHYAEGTCEGQIIPYERGQGGFGYDPIFKIESRDETMAELPAEVKNQISHRARAVQAAYPRLLEILRK
ncbi:MAG: RdgB/HAM1 family non-canonical purine NTP pyrophosphatase [Anaerolineales bacterium]|nr:RdgB/HAM1 family non-canonical purine NTP pyrophosphatase [Anaerolineales bacterium]